MEKAHYVARLLQEERRLRGTPKDSRALTPFRQAVMVLGWFRGERDIPKLGRDHRVSRATAYRYIHEGIKVLAAQAPDLPEALDRAQADELPYVILDGTLVPIDRCAEQTLSVKGEPIDVWYS
ncbi:IS5/IS1182 family transposase, partial [Nonomuraea sp. NPDC046570]